MHSRKDSVGAKLVQGSRTIRTQYTTTELLLDKQILNKLVFISFKWKIRYTIMKYQIR